MSTPVIENPTLTEDISPFIMEELFPFEETEDPNTRAHYVNPPKNLHIYRKGMTSREMVDIARIQGLEIEALCGYRWIPKYNPDKFDLCEKCSHIAQQMMSDRGE